MNPNPTLDLAPFGRWTLRDKAAQRRSATRWAVKTIATAFAFLVTSAVAGEMSLGRWLDVNEPKVRGYLLALKPEQIGTKVPGVKLVGREHELKGYQYLANLSQPDRGLYMYKFRYTYRGNLFETHYIWVAKGYRSHDLSLSPLCSGEWIEPGGWGVLSGDQYTYQEVQPGERIVVTTCQLTLPNPSINTDAAR